uniref:hypothetical protein n=1 Tax=Arthrobacter sp. TaxID=1667 RepID=UPI000EB78DC1|nr:hypothetical protein [Arthrobacter sp.]AXV46662.1 hypothetical protein pA58H3_p47 [Arthrobacter sp.]
MTEEDPDEFQAMLNERDDIDLIAVDMSRFQAQKCAAIIMAGQAGHTSYTEASTTVAHYLRAIALDGVRKSSQMPSNSDDLWQLLEHLPWPRSGPPAEQPS